MSSVENLWDLRFGELKRHKAKHGNCNVHSRLDSLGNWISNYDTNKTHLDEAPFGRADDDYGPGSEPPPHDRKRYVSTFMLSRRRPPAAVGKPSFPRFKVYYLPRRRVLAEPRPLDFPD
ncbi:hypothetical protein THAOC_07478 [Thalassiosira oceanica]|uniref:Helicase-associated domain-containing protein n=1 Tax=Thalassiosira oceanica TaxID=159749 RepID=K0SXF9_THAOC|nr:hypothetical protein THAOC_07478 [Thalassiosira oceanica]|eukprot:EJK71113.1 hypothetical protein THAOC_07478 [Thalassiosira oceanica]